MKKDKEPFYQKLAWWLPPKLIYFVLIRAWANAATGKYGNVEAPVATMDDVIRRWEELKLTPKGSN